MITEKQARIAYQLEQLEKRQAEMEAAQKAREEYLNSEAYERDIHEHMEDLWEAKAQREGRTYQRKPFVGALAALKERLAALEQK